MIIRLLYYMLNLLQNSFYSYLQNSWTTLFIFVRCTLTQSDTQKFITFRLSIDPVIIERCTIAHWNHLAETSRMVIISFFYDNRIARYLTKRQKSGFFTFMILRHLTFCRISRHPMIVERQISHHLIRFDETIPTSYETSFYDHWINRQCYSQFFKCLQL